ncbi:MAG: hypothetical protein ACYTBP_10720 [Planctomycetota bacterium]
MTPKKNISSSLALLTIFIVFFASGESFADTAMDTQIANYSDNKEIKMYGHFLNMHGFCALSINVSKPGDIIV